MRTQNNQAIKYNIFDYSGQPYVMRGFGEQLTDPVLYIVTQDSMPVNSKETYVNCTYEIRDNGGDGATLFFDTGRIRGRGNSTWTMPKKPYKVKLDHTLPILGMPASKDFALLANYVDPSKIRNQVAFEMSNRIGLPWAPRTVNVEVYLNGAYRGLYGLCESVEVDVNRVNIAKIKATDTAGSNLTGGYVMEVDTRLEENNEIGWRTRLGVPIIFDVPDGDVSQQFDYMKNYTQQAEDALYSEDFLDGDWKNYFDVDSWVKWYLMTELTSNNDSGFGASVKITKPRDPGKLMLGPAWDYDASFGITFFIPHPPNVWWTRVGATWIVRMLEDPSFVVALKNRWSQFKVKLEQVDYSIYDFIGDLQAQISPALARDQDVWGAGSGSDVASYLSSRLSWMDNELMNESTLKIPPDTPSGFTATADASGVTFSWEYVTPDNGLGIIGYRVRNEGNIIAQTAYPYSDPINSVVVKNENIGPGNSYTIEARSAVGDWSQASSPISI